MDTCALVSAHARPLFITLTPGQRHEMIAARELLAHARGKAFIADTGYDSNDFLHARQWFTALFEYCAHHPRHPGLGLFTLPNVFFGRTHQLVAVRKRTLEAAYQAHPGRFVR